MNKIIIFVIAFLVLPPIVKTTEEVYHNQILPTLEIDNLVINGDFSNGQTNWYKLGTGVTYTFNGEMYASYSGALTDGGINQNINFINNNLYYISFQYKGNDTSPNLYIEHCTSTFTSRTQIYRQETTLPTIYTNYSNIWTSNKTISKILIYNAYQAYTDLYLDNIMILDISKFNTEYGLSWTKSNFDTLIATYGYFDHLSIPLSPNFNVDLSKLGLDIIKGIKEDVLDYVRDGACIASSVANVITIGAIKKPKFCPTTIQPHWVHDFKETIKKWLGIGG